MFELLFNVALSSCLLRSFSLGSIILLTIFLLDNILVLHGRE